jgi:hypothetical protein
VKISQGYWNGWTWVKPSRGEILYLATTSPLLLVCRIIHQEASLYHHATITFKFQNLLEMKNYMANTTFHHLGLVSTYKALVRKKKWENADLAWGLKRALSTVYDQVEIVEEEIYEKQGSRLAVATVGGTKSAEVVQRWKDMVSLTSVEMAPPPPPKMTLRIRTTRNYVD